MPHHPVVGDFRIRDFSIEARLNACRVRLLERLRQWRRRPRKWLKPRRPPDLPGGSNECNILQEQEMIAMPSHSAEPRTWLVAGNAQARVSHREQ